LERQSKDAAKATAYDGLLSRQKETTAASTCHEATEKRALRSFLKKYNNGDLRSTFQRGYNYV
jgi:hypothetical protein